MYVSGEGLNAIRTVTLTLYITSTTGATKYSLALIGSAMRKMSTITFLIFVMVKV